MSKLHQYMVTSVLKGKETKETINQLRVTDLIRFAQIIAHLKGVIDTNIKFLYYIKIILKNLMKNCLCRNI